MKILVQQHVMMTVLTEYLDFNRIDYQKIDLWHPSLDDHGRYYLDPALYSGREQLMIMHSNVFESLYFWAPSWQRVLDWLHRGNRIWVWNDLDGWRALHPYAETECQWKTWNLGRRMWECLDPQIPAQSVTVFLDAEPSNHHWCRDLVNTRLRVRPVSCWMRLARLPGSQVNKMSDAKDYMLMTIKKSSRPHRHLLWKELAARDGILERGHVSYRRYRQGWSGDTSHQHQWQDGHPSMDLYLHSNVELVPETLYKNWYFFTEKTCKPISTCTPFLMISTRGYLGYLRDLGFRTFDHIIDESYDQQHRIQDRVRMAVDQLQEIITRGSRWFYLESRPVLEHNRKRLAELDGSWHQRTDAFLRACWEELG